jgi:Protein of unknown function (DUF5818)
MQRYSRIVAGVVIALFSGVAAAQVASGNVAESSHPRADVLNAQNPHIHRTVEGCLARQGNEYTLTVKHLGVIALSGSDQLSQYVGQRVKVRGNLAPVTVQDVDDDASAVVTGNREMTVERITGAAGVCPAP